MLWQCTKNPIHLFFSLFLFYFFLFVYTCFDIQLNFFNFIIRFNGPRVSSINMFDLTRFKVQISTYPIWQWPKHENMVSNLCDLDSLFFRFSIFFFFCNQLRNSFCLQALSIHFEREQHTCSKIMINIWFRLILKAIEAS